MKFEFVTLSLSLSRENANPRRRILYFLRPTFFSFSYGKRSLIEKLKKSDLFGLGREVAETRIKISDTMTRFLGKRPRRRRVSLRGLKLSPSARNRRKSFKSAKLNGRTVTSIPVSNLSKRISSFRHLFAVQNFPPLVLVLETTDLSNFHFSFHNDNDGPRI